MRRRLHGGVAESRVHPGLKVRLGTQCTPVLPKASRAPETVRMAWQCGFVTACRMRGSLARRGITRALASAEEWHSQRFRYRAVVGEWESVLSVQHLALAHLCHWDECWCVRCYLGNADPCRQCSIWSMLICVLPVQHFGHIDLCGQCSTSSMCMLRVSATVWPDHGSGALGSGPWARGPRLWAWA